MYDLLKKTFSNTLIYSLGNLSTKLTGFILIPFYTRHLSIDAYGVFGILEVTSTAIIAIFGLNLYSAFARWYYDKDYSGQQRSIFYTLTLFLTLFTSVISIPIILLSSEISQILFDLPDYATVVVYMIISSMIQIVTTIPATLLRLQDKPGMFVTTNVLRLAFILMFTILLLSYYDMGLEGIFLAQVGGNILYMLMLARYSFRNFVPSFNTPALREMLHFSLPLMYASLSALLIMLADKYILRVTSGLGSSGVYSFGYKIANTVYYFFVESVNLALSPIIFNLMNQENNKRFYSKIMTYLTLIVLLMILVVSLFGKELIVLLARNPDYHQASNIIPIIAFSALFLTMKDTAVRALSIAKKTKTISAILIVVSMFNLGLNAILIPQFSFYGAAFAYLATQIMYFLLVYRAAQKHYPIRYETWKITLMASITISFLALGMFFLDEVSITNIAIKVGLLIIFPVLLYFFNFYEKIELQRMKELFTKSK